MQPLNSKSVLHFLFGQMEKLDNRQIDVHTAKAQADLAKQAHNLIKYELDRAKTLMSLEQHNKEYNSNIELRNIEGKNFE